MGQNKRIGLREVRDLAAGEVVYDAALAGFAVRRQGSEVRTFLVRYRTVDGRQRWHTIGRWGPLTPDQAREEARQVLARVAQGEDPAAEKKRRREAPTIAWLCDEYLSAAEAGQILGRNRQPKRASTLVSDRGRLERHVKPLLGALKVAAVTTREIERFMHDVAAGKTAERKATGKKRGLSNVRGGQGAASRTVGLLGAVFTYAIREGMRPDNPVRGVTRFADQARERRLSEDEYALLGSALSRAEASGVWPPAIAAARLLLVTGWRSGEAIGLEWTNVDLARRTARLPTTKTGLSVRPLSQVACDILAAQPRANAFRLPSHSGDRPYERLSEDLGAHRCGRWPAARHHAPRIAAQLRQLGGRPRLLRGDGSAG